MSEYISQKSFFLSSFLMTMVQSGCSVLSMPSFHFTAELLNYVLLQRGARGSRQSILRLSSGRPELVRPA